MCAFLRHFNLGFSPHFFFQIVCKFFIDAIETQKFGWFWECPNGQLCQYRHALPPGFVLRSQKKAADDAAKANQISLEEFLEVEVRFPDLCFLDLVLNLR